MIASGSKLLACLLLLLLSPSLATADSIETRVKAAFLFKFCQYIEWPDDSFHSADTPLTIAVVGADDLARELREAVADRRIGERPVRIRQLQPDDGLEDVQVLFVGSGSSLANYIEMASRLPVLTVTEDGGHDDTGIINFVIVNNRVRFDIAQNRANLAGLKLSSLLLSVARNVRQEPSP
ncbi:MAG: YfiR family protein [Gammaproteobacteria bacterium]|nr:MAG: YfiR family protein [Gammaproteobacteria bacterium]